MAGDVRGGLDQIMSDLCRSTDILAVVIARRDGLVVAARLPRDADPRKVAAMSAAIVGTAEMASAELGQGEFEEALVECSGGKILCTGAGREALLVALIKGSGNVGLTLIQLQRAARRIQEIIGEVVA